MDCVRKVLANQMNLTSQGTDFVHKDRLTKDSKYPQYQKTMNTGGVPSEQVIEQHVKKEGKDYRYLLKGQHPVERLRKAA